MRRILALFFALTPVLLFSGCALFQDGKKNDPEYQLVSGFVHDPEFQKENLPTRTLRVAVLAHEWVGDDFVRSVFAEASQMLEAQVGIRLEVALFHEPPWRTRSLFRMHRVLKEFRRAHSEFDVVVGVSLESMEDEEQWWCPDSRSVCSIGMVNEWRNMALLTLVPMLIVHETGHLFLETIWHSPRGVMVSSLGSPASSSFFSVADRERILRNKWKDFRRDPSLLETCLGFC